GLASSNDSEDYARLNRFWQIARASLDAPPDPLNFSAANGAIFEGGFDAPQLQSAKQALNDYVHPNYGSHIAALFPEHAAAARILLEGLIAAYDAFFTLSWAERSPTERSASLGIGPLKSWPATMRRFTKRVVPDVQNKSLSDINAGRVASEVQDVFNAHA